MATTQASTCDCGTTMVERRGYLICEHCDIPQQHSTAACSRCRRIMTIRS